MNHKANSCRQINFQQLQNLSVSQMDQSSSQAPQEYQILRSLALQVSMRLPAELFVTALLDSTFQLSKYAKDSEELDDKSTLYKIV